MVVSHSMAIARQDLTDFLVLNAVGAYSAGPVELYPCRLHLLKIPTGVAEAETLAEPYRSSLFQ